MKKLFAFIYISAFSFFITACSHHSFDVPNNTYTPETTYQKLIAEYPFITIASRNIPSNVKEIKNITYQSYGNRYLQLDLYLPKQQSSQARAAIIFVHGGGWRAGYRTNFTPFAIGMAKRGYVAATISYRLSPEALYPAAIYDVKAAIRWLRKSANKYGVNPDQIAIAGGSAGGQIAYLTGVTNGLKKFDPQSSISAISSDVQAIINIDGLSDFTSKAVRIFEDDPRKNPSAAGAWFGGRYHEKTSLWKEASPIYYINKNTPPTLFIISNQERFSLGHQESMQKMQSYSIFSQVKKIPNSPHSFWLFDPWLTPSIEHVDQFLKKAFYSK